MRQPSPPSSATKLPGFPASHPPSPLLLFTIQYINLRKFHSRPSFHVSTFTTFTTSLSDIAPWSPPPPPLPSPISSPRALEQPILQLDMNKLPEVLIGQRRHLLGRSSSLFYSSLLRFRPSPHPPSPPPILYIIQYNNPKATELNRHTTRMKIRGSAVS